MKVIENPRAVQKQAFDHSRMGYPVLISMAVTRGSETMASITLDGYCTWMVTVIDESIRFAVIDASFDGLSCLFRGVVDISRNSHWGRGAAVSERIRPSTP